MNVAICYAYVIDSDKVQVTISNAYPSYSCTIWSGFKTSAPNRWAQVTHRSPPQRTDGELFVGFACNVLKPSSKVYQRTVVHVEQSANQNATYQFVIEAGFETGHRCK
jgi:hypothetical protein